jgi:hypothetical protein
MLTIKSLEKAERFVKSQNNKGNDLWWEGWDIMSFAPNEAAVYSKNGAYRHGAWGFQNRYAVNAQGEWEIDRRDVLK